jgi:hypothetical protein
VFSPLFFLFFSFNDQSLKAAADRRITMDDPTDNHRKHSHFEEGIPNETALCAVSFDFSDCTNIIKLNLYIQYINFGFHSDITRSFWKIMRCLLGDLISRKENKITAS